jgi:hypothetical protein
MASAYIDYNIEKSANFAGHMQLTPLFPTDDVALDYQSLYKSVAEQIRKDFHPHIEMRAIPFPLSSEWLFNEISRMLGAVIMHQNQNLGAIIYRVDLPEKTTRRTMNSSETGSRLDELAAMILKREAQKVWIRQHYSS